MEIKVTFNGILADIAGTRMKTYNGIASSAELEMRLSDDFPGIQNYGYRISRNSEFITGDLTLKDGDEIELTNQFRDI
ncbi:MAG TPA: MoaD/ThiS family protein [Bacteroidales bacterium]|jgi:hypothetical protein|nr:MoaD/ThiS family protein [Bacteroidales bacterium]